MVNAEGLIELTQFLQMRISSHLVIRVGRRNQIRKTQMPVSSTLADSNTPGGLRFE